MFEIQNLTWCRWRPTSSILTTILRASYRFGRAHLFDIDTRILVIMSFRTCFDRDDGDGAFSVTNTYQARRRDDDNEDSEEEAIDCMAKNVINFILLHQEEEGDRRQE